MDYEIDWLPSADDELLDVWLRHPHDRIAINAASRVIERILSRDAHRLGTSIDNYRYIIVGPLGFLFTASSNEGRAVIIEVRYVP